MNIYKIDVLFDKCMAILGVLLFFVALLISFRDYTLEKRAVTVNATIIEVMEENMKSHIKVRYYVDDNYYDKEFDTKEQATVNDFFVLKYDKYQPNHLINNNHILLISICLSLSFIFSVLFIPITLKRSFKKLKFNKWRRKKSFVSAKIVSIYKDSNGTVKRGIVPYKIRLQFVDAQSNKLYLFESESLYYDVSEICSVNSINYLPVYLNPKNSFEYYVDTTIIEEKAYEK